MKNPKQYCRRLRKGIQMHKNIFLIEDSHIPDWLLVEVFVRLPVKSVFMCKCVSKRWLSLISEPFFVQLFISKRTNKMDSSSSTSPDSTLPWTLLFRHKSGNKIRCNDQRVHDSRASVILYPEFKSPSFSLSFLPLKKNNKRCFQVEAVASSNGLLLCCSATMPGGSLSVLYFFICNPFTMKWIVLPDPPSNPRFNMDAGLISQDDGTYKVVRMVFVADHSSEVYIYFEVFCSRTGAWSVNKVWFPFKKGVFPHKPPTNYRGILHWLEINNRRIIAYNPYKDTSQCRFICLPKDVYIFKEKLIGISCGCLCYIELVHTLNVWVLLDYDNEEWQLRHQIDLELLTLNDIAYIDKNKEDGSHVTPMAMHPFDLDVVYLKPNRVGVGLLSCNLGTKKLEEVCQKSATVIPFVLPPWPTPVPEASWTDN